MPSRSSLAVLVLSATLAGGAAPALAQETPTYRVDVPERVEVDRSDEGTPARTYLVIGLSTAAVLGLLLLVVLLARAGDGHPDVRHHH